MIKVEIEMKPEASWKFEDFLLSDAMFTLDKTFREEGIPCIEKTSCRRVYESKNASGDYGAMWSIILSLEEEAWFMDNVVTFMFYNTNGSEREEDYESEDILAENAEDD